MEKFEAVHRQLIKYVSRLTNDAINDFLLNGEAFDTHLYKIANIMMDSEVDKFAFGMEIHQKPFLSYREIGKIYFQMGNRQQKLKGILVEC